METILAGLTITWFLYYFAFACFGQLFSIVLQQVKYAPRIKAYGGFSIVIWFKENWVRFLLTIMTMVAGILFTEPLTSMVAGQALKLNEWSAFLSGLLTDKIIDSLLNRKK